MKKGYLSAHFRAFGFKRLSAVELKPKKSHQHEFQGTKDFRSIFGTRRRTVSASFLFLTDKTDGPTVAADGTLTWYNAREGKPRSPEYRFYYPASIDSVLQDAQPGDLLVLAERSTGNVVVVVASAGTTAESQLMWLFGIDLEQPSDEFDFRTIESREERELGLAGELILARLGIEVRKEDDNHLEEMIRRFKTGLPDTRTFSDYARRKCRGISALEDPDRALIGWMEMEESLFRTFERHLIGERLKKGFDGDVDGFIDFSLSVQNRRKSRAGKAMENHLEVIFREYGVRHDRGKVTEGRSRPDFLFPGTDEYRSARWPDEKLTMLGVKTTCKDRWRQILAEANRIKEKHLITLEPGISLNQTTEMTTNRVQLILPRALHGTYAHTQRGNLMDLRGFVELVGKRQLD